MEQIENYHNKRFKLKPKHTYPYIKYKWPEHPHYKAKIVRMDKKARPNRCCLQKIHFKYKNTNRLNVNDRENYINMLTLIKRNREPLY